MDGAGISRGYLDFLAGQQQRALNDQRLRAGDLDIDQASRTQQARAAVGPLLLQLLGSQGQPDVGAGGPAIPMAPPTPAAAQAPLPGTPSMPANPAAPVGTGTVLAPDPNAPPPTPGPYLSYEDAIAKAQQPPALPPAPAALPAAPAAPAPRALSVGGIVQGLKKANVPDNLVMDVLTQLTPVMSAENKAELNALTAQFNVQKEQHRVEADSVRNQIRQGELDRKEERDRMDASYKDASLQQRAQLTNQRLSAENARTNIMTAQLTRLAKNDVDKAALNDVKNVQAQLQAVQREYTSLSNMIVNGDAATRESAKVRMNQLEIAADELSKVFDEKAKSFADNSGKDQTSGASAPASGERPPKPTEPGYDYKFDATTNQWLRRKKQ